MQSLRLVHQRLDCRSFRRPESRHDGRRPLRERQLRRSVVAMVNYRPCEDARVDVTSPALRSRSEHGVEARAPPAVADHQGEALEERHAARLEGGQGHRPRELRAARPTGARTAGVAAPPLRAGSPCPGSRGRTAGSTPGIALQLREVRRGRNRTGGVQPRAPGIMSQPSSGFWTRGLLLCPVRGIGVDDADRAERSVDRCATVAPSVARQRHGHAIRAPARWRVAPSSSGCRDRIDQSGASTRARHRRPRELERSVPAKRVSIERGRAKVAVLQTAPPPPARRLTSVRPSS